MLHFRIKRGLLALLIFTASCVGAVTSESSPSAAVNSTLLSSSHPSHPPRPPSSDRGYGPEQSSNRAGLLTTRTHRRNLWYWFFESRSAPETDPLVLWLSGGPGCGSLIALFQENGPYRIDPMTLELSVNFHSWNNKANVIWLDQPTQTGFSYSSDKDDVGPLTEREIAQDIYEFLIEFLRENKSFRQREVFLTGESYSGHYLPALASAILGHNHRARLARSKEHGRRWKEIKLRGVALGNPLVDPLHQYPSYARFAYDHQVVTREQYLVMQATTQGCTEMIRHCRQTSAHAWHSCLSAHALCMYSVVLPVAASGVNVYDVRKQCGREPLCYDMKHIERFLGQPEVREALGVSHLPHSPRKWHECNPQVNQRLALSGDWMLSFAKDLPAVLKEGVRVLVYVGEEDWICNWYGNLSWMLSLRWSGSHSFRSASNQTWSFDGEKAGTVKSAKGLTFLRVKEAGHMVPMDQPERALDLFERFINDEKFSD